MSAGTIDSVTRPLVLEVCAGGGGQAFGLEEAGFEHAAAVEIDEAACATLRMNRPAWNVIERDLRDVDASDFKGVDLFAGGVPCPPFSVAGKQLGPNDERDLFPAALAMIRKIKPRAVLLENVPGFASAKFTEYRNDVLAQLVRMGFVPDWRVLNACDFGVPQLRPRFILVALRPEFAENFAWPKPLGTVPTVGDALADLMAVHGWRGSDVWVSKAKGIGPTVVGGSKKHGGPDLGPTRAREGWAALSVDGTGIANDAPWRDFPVEQSPKLTLRMVARVQGFKDDWIFSGRKTAAYRQIGNAFPPPVAEAVGRAVRLALQGAKQVQPSTRRPFQLALPR